MPSADSKLLRQKAEMIAEAHKPKDAASISSQQEQILLHELQVHQIELEMQNEELRRQHDELEESKNLYFDLYELAPIGYLTLDIKGNILKTNITFSKLCDIPKSKLLKHPLTSLIFFDDQDIFYKYHQKLISTRDKDYCELRMLRDDGSIFWAHLDSNISLSSGDETLLLLAISDVSERKKMEETLKKSEKILLINSRRAAMGEMVGMIAHQWRQPLNAVSAAAIKLSILSEVGKLSPLELDKTLTFIQEMSKKMSATIKDFMEFAKPNRSKENIAIKDVVIETLKMMSAQLTVRNIDVNIDIHEALKLDGYKNELSHVLLNCLSNARDAFENKDISNKMITMHAYQDGNFVFIEILDNAGGIEDSIIDRVFDPFFTTKVANKGTGLGLYMSKKILEEHFEGSIMVTSTDNGAKFTIRVPNLAIYKAITYETD